MKNKYTTARAFRAALEQRIADKVKSSKTTTSMLRKQVTFEAFLRRVSMSHHKMTLKGGFLLQTNFEFARATKDIDFTVSNIRLAAEEDEKAVVNQIHSLLTEIAATQTDDFFKFFVKESILNLDGPKYGGYRFPVQATLDDRRFENFLVDIAIGDLVFNPRQIEYGEIFSFANLPRFQVKSLTTEQQFAEKLHAYVRSRGDVENSRVKDLYDMWLIVRGNSVNKADLKTSIKEVFQFRDNDLYRNEFPEPPLSWGQKFDDLVKTAKVEAVKINEAVAIVRIFLETLEI